MAGALDVDPDFGQDAGLFAGVQGVVDGLLDGRQQGLARVVETQQVAILGKELADGDVALAGGHRLGGGPAAMPRAARRCRRRRRWTRPPAIGLHFRGRTSGQSRGSSRLSFTAQRRCDEPVTARIVLAAEAVRSTMTAAAAMRHRARCFARTVSAARLSASERRLRRLQ